MSCESLPGGRSSDHANADDGGLTLTLRQTLGLTMGGTAVRKTIGEVAALAGVSVRTLHHYDDIGLLVPNVRSASGYRIYDDADLERLQEVLFFRTLGFELAEIRRLMQEPDYDRLGALEQQRAMLERKVGHLRAMIASIDTAADAQRNGVAMNEEDMFEVFGEFDVVTRTREAGERWPGDALDESQRRTSRYSKEQWREAMAEADALATEFAAAKAGGAPADGPAATEIAERHRLHIDRWFYPCSPQMHVQLGDLYVGDTLFADHWNRVEPRLAAFVRDAIKANAAR